MKKKFDKDLIDTTMIKELFICMLIGFGMIILGACINQSLVNFAGGFIVGVPLPYVILEIKEAFV